MLISGHLFKDVVLKGTGHGAWTHLIQWWCVVSKAKQDPSFLRNNPADIYKMVGAFDLEFKTKYWSKLFEAANSTASFGNFYKLDIFFRNKAKVKLPVLAQFIERYENKPTGYKL